MTDLAIKLCRALEHAHDAGVIHRDIKPANLLLSETGEIKLSDFGIARLFGNTRMTSDGGVLGTAEYMAPEQADGRVVTDRCDQYSLGGVMYALLAGRPPFRAGSLVEMLQLQRFAEAEPVRRYAPDTPAELDQIIRQLLEKDPQHRFVNALILGRSLESMQRGLSLPPATERDDFIVTGQPKPRPSRPSIRSRQHSRRPKRMTRLPHDHVRASTDPIFTQTAVHSEAPASASTPRPTAPETPWPPGSSRSKSRPPRPLAPRGLVDAHGLADLADRGRLGGDRRAGLVHAQTSVGRATVRRNRKDDRPCRSQFASHGEPAAGKVPRALSRRCAPPAIDEQLQEAKDLRSKRQLELKNRRLNRPAVARSPVERAYREALFYKIPDPDTALARFQALLNLYGHDPGADDNEWIRLARAEVALLGNQLAEDHGQDLAAIEAQLAAAEAQRASDPAAAQKTWQAIVTLYGDKPWAARVVDQARQALAGTTPP